MANLNNKRVLLVAPRFFEYEQEIRSEIESRGASVDWLPDRPFDTPFMKAVTRFLPQMVLPSVDRLYFQMLNGFGASHYDFILVVNGQTLSEKFLSFLRASFPKAQTVLYIWDSFENRPGVVTNLPLFDKVLSFDPLNANDYGMQFRPLFFSKGFEQPPKDDFDYHLSFIGTAHSDRYSVIDHVKKNLDKQLCTYWYLYLQAPWVFYAYRVAKPGMRSARRSEFHFTPLDKSAFQSVLARSKAILDIEHPRQRGLTMRAFETMASHKKLITTNSQIRDYDFFNADNICIIDRLAPTVPSGFLESAYTPVPPKLYERYSLSGWLNEVLGLIEGQEI